jgi:exopolyphosphatase/guanosine-5'-triphosphate,3'-diphosphate pyrophosphatase
MPEANAPQFVAVLDIGSSAVRMVVAEIGPQGDIRELEQLEQPLELGRDVFSRGRVRRKTLARLVSLLGDFRRVLALYEVKRVRAVATSALREATNREVVLDQIYLRHGFDVEVIGPAFEKHLLLLGVREELGEGLDLHDGCSLIVEVGGGSTELTLLRDGAIAASETLPLGSLRMREVVPDSAGTPAEVLRLRRRHVRQAVSRVGHKLALGEVELMVAVGGEVRTVIDLRQPDKPSGAQMIAADELTRFVKDVRAHSPDRIARKLGMPWPKAEAFVPALLVYDYLLRETSAEQVLVPMASVRTGILRELATEVAGTGQGELARLPTTSALELGRRFRFDEQHARQVTRLSLSLFDQLQELHGLGPRARLLLECAALLHDIGTFIHHMDHDRHGEYLLRASEVFGLGRREHALVAAIVRHHRAGVPDDSDPGFGSLNREERLLCLRLLGVLRLGDVLDRRAQAAVETVRVERGRRRIHLAVEPPVDLYYERAAFPEKASLFEDIFGIPVELR